MEQSVIWTLDPIELSRLDGFSDSLVKNGCTEHVKSVNANYAQWNAHIHVLFSLAISRRLDGRPTSWKRLPQMTLSDRLFFQWNADIPEPFGLAFDMAIIRLAERMYR